ncbi:unnamed protein product [Ophioblennius macclurei]
MEAEEKLDASASSHAGQANLSHLTPNTSLGFVQATPSRALPSPTVNTREALGVIMDMFQASTFLENPFEQSLTPHAAQRDDFDAANGSASAAAMPPAQATTFTVFQDDGDKENGGVPSTTAAAAAPPPPAAEKSKSSRVLRDITTPKPDKPNDTPPALAPDDSTMWGARYNSLHSLAACPNSTTDFAMLAHCVSTPFASKSSSSSSGGVSVYRDQEDDCDADAAEEDGFVRRQTMKLSPIMEQSPSDDTLSSTLPSSTSSARHGTIVGEALPPAPSCLADSASVTMMQPPPPAALSFRDHTLFAADGSERPPTPAAPTRTGELFEILEDQDQDQDPDLDPDLDRPASPARDQGPACDVPMSPDCPLNPDWMTIRSPEVPAGADLDAFASPCRPAGFHAASFDVPMSPDQHPPHCADVSMTSPVREPRSDHGGSAATAAPLVSDPWSQQLVSQQLAALRPPLTSHPNCFTWQCGVPNITPKTTISMGRTSLRIDSVVGQGAFATVYQVTDPQTFNKMVFKVQKPANPWEFYINNQLDARLPPAVRHLYSRLRSAHLFHDGSVLLGELHKYGTLLNAVNIYKGLSDKVMPLPLAMYFSACILHMVEQLHAVSIIHADIKPDNFLLGDSFLEDSSFEPDGGDHGLVLIDLGQSVDMQLYPAGTAFTTRCLTSGFQCTEMLSGKPWNYQTDYFGVAGTVHCMLFGSYMQVVKEDGVWKTNGVFRRKPHSDLWQDFFHTLLNAPHGGAAPDLAGLRRRLTEALRQDYSGKLATLKSRLVVQLLENHKAARR